MKAALVTGALALATWMALGGAAAAKEWKGKWHPGAHSTLEFIGAGRLVYCYEQNCIKTAYSGDANSELSFRWGKARFTFTKSAGQYDGIFRQGANRSTITMK